MSKFRTSTGSSLSMPKETPIVHPAMEALIHVTASVANEHPEGIVRLCDELLVLDNRRSRSCLNNDGFPLQVCINSTGDRRVVRLIGDPAAHLSNPIRRYKRAHQALLRLLESRESTGVNGLCDDTLQVGVPNTPTAIHELENGAIWLGVSVGQPGVALYTNACWGDKETRWPRALKWLRRTLADADEACCIIEKLIASSELASMGLEGSCEENARAKIYWRLKRPQFLSTLGVPLFTHPFIGDFLVRVIGEGEISLTGLVLSAGFSVASGVLIDAKVDVCAHCVPRPAESWIELLQNLVKAYDLTPLGIEDALMEGRCQVAFLGFGLDLNRMYRLNVYLNALIS